MIGIIFGVFGSSWKLVNANWGTRAIAGLIVIVGAWKTNNIIVGKKAVARHVEKSVKAGEAINARNLKKRKRIYAAPGNLGDLPCRDC
ncbi:MAG: hypothetical protein OEL78_01610 [Hyphomicrobiales bacterium]|nr:hypothetical protein [Hyphomicrobiales bacterium]